nr:hypothetical protein SEVIR_7G269700v2 [Setaria viridis]
MYAIPRSPCLTCHCKRHASFKPLTTCFKARSKLFHQLSERLWGDGERDICSISTFGSRGINRKAIGKDASSTLLLPQAVACRRRGLAWSSPIHFLVPAVCSLR